MAKKTTLKKQVPLSEAAYRRIKDQIITLKLHPGEQIDEGGLAESLSIGRTPIREALFRLAAEDLVKVSRGRGFSVRNLSLSDLKALFETMMIMERAAAALAARRIKKESIASLRETNRELKKAWQKKDFLQVTLLNSRFHRTIYQAIENVFLNSYLDTMQSQAQRLAFLCFSEKSTAFDINSHAELAIKDHRNLIAAFERRDEEMAVSLIGEHIKLFQRRVYDYASPSFDRMELIL